MDEIDENNHSLKLRGETSSIHLPTLALLALGQAQLSASLLNVGRRRFSFNIDINTNLVNSNQPFRFIVVGALPSRLGFLHFNDALLGFQLGSFRFRQLLSSEHFLLLLSELLRDLSDDFDALLQVLFSRLVADGVDGLDGFRR